MTTHVTPTSEAEDASASTYNLSRRLLRSYVRPHLWKLLAAVALMAVAAAATAALAKLMEPVLDEIFVAKDSERLHLISLAVLVIFAAKGIASYGQAVLVNLVGQRIIATLQKQLFAHLMGAELAFFNRQSTGMLISRFTHDVNLLRATVSNVLTGVGKDSLTLIFLVAVMFSQDWKLALIAFVVFPIAVLPIVWVGRKMRTVTTDVQQEMAEFTTHLEQTFQEMRHVQAYGMEAEETRRSDTMIERLFKMIFRAARTKAISRPIMEMLGGVAIVTIIFFGGAQVIEGTRTTGSFFSFITALLLAYEPMKKLANLNAHLQEGLSAAERVFDMLDHQSEIMDAQDAQSLELSQGEIQFTKVGFAYAADTPVLQDVSLQIPAGKTVALVGPSGAGKSTLLNLIPRFYDVSTGAVSIDGQDVRSVHMDSLRQKIALVAQEVGLFDRSIRDNIAFGKPEATQQEIEEAARNAAAHDFITDLPQGYDTVVGERGVNLSGGQRQRIAIARAFLKNAPILLLDEATSSLDTQSEAQVQAALKTLMASRTTVVIAHRLSTIIEADKICVLSGGQVVEEGTHQELLAKSGLYADLYDIQFAEQAA